MMTIKPEFRIACLLVLSATAWAPATLAQSGNRTWNFDGDAVGKPPTNFTSALTGQGAIGRWEVMKDDTAPSPSNVLAQTSADSTDYRFPLAIADDTSYKDFSLSVKFKTLSGKVDQGAGLVFRLQDKGNYYVVRANALENNYRLYHVIKGRRVQFAGANFKVTPNTWHAIKVEARGNEFKCFYDGQLKITARDDTFKGAGKIGLWTKADSVIHFDDLVVEGPASAKDSTAQGRIVAQKLVVEFAAKHTDVVRVALHITPPHGPDNLIVACNIAARVGKKSDPEDIQAMLTGRPVVLKEEGNFDVTLPLHTASGKVIGAIGLTFKPQDNEQESGATARARKMAAEVEKQIPSKAGLFEIAG
jgi:hypothetical protein